MTASARLLMTALAAVCLMAAGVQSQPNPDVCTPHDPTSGGPSLPTLPQRFRLRVEANILGWNNTVEVVEFYDAEKNRGAVQSIGGGNITQTVMNYDTGEIITVKPDGGCSVRNLTAGGFNIFGFTLQNGSAHIGSVSDIFRFGAAYNDTYVGTSYVRGIPVNHWRSCLYNDRNNGTSSLDYFFTIPGYGSPYGDAEIPLRLVLNGTANNQKFVDGHIVSTGGMHNYSHVYEFFDVEFHPEFEDQTFEPKLGVVCPGRKSLKPLPTIPDHFRQGLEVVLPDKKMTFYLSETYNYKSKLVSYEYSYSKNYSSSSPPSPFRALDDFNTGLTYRMNMSNGFCNITPISLYSPDAFSPDHAHVQLKEAASFFYFGSHDWVYQGVTKLRSMDTESWISMVTDWSPNWLLPKGFHQVNSTWEYFFTKADWQTQGGLSKSSNMPVMHSMRWTARMDNGSVINGTIVMNSFHFDTVVDDTQFDLTSCFRKVDREEMAFDLSEKGVYNMYIANNTVAFYRGAKHSIAMAANVSPLRITNIVASEGWDGITTVFFTVLGVPGTKGDAVEMKRQTPLPEAIGSLEIMLLNEKDTFFLEFDHNGKKMSVTAEHGTLRNEFSPISYKDDGKMFSLGAFIGFGIAMLILGIAFSAGCLIFLHKRMNTELPYNVQE